MSEEKYITKKELKEELNSFGQVLRAEMQASNQGLRAEMQASNQDLRAEMQASSKALKAEITAIFIKHISQIEKSFTEKVGQVEEKFFKYSIISVGLILGGVGLIQYVFSNGQKQPIVIYTQPPNVLREAPVDRNNIAVYPQPQMMQEGSQQEDTRQPQQTQ